MIIKSPKLKNILGSLFIIVSLISFYTFMIFPSYTTYSDTSFYSGILGPYTYEDSDLGGIQSYAKLYGYPTFNNDTPIGFTPWYLTIGYNWDDDYQWNQRIEIRLDGLAGYGSETNTIWSHLPDDFLRLDISSLHYLRSRDNIDYTFEGKQDEQIDNFSFLGKLSAQEKVKFDRTHIQEKIELTLLLDNAVVTDWFYNDCESQECIQKLSIRIEIQFHEKCLFGSWNKVREVI